MKPFKNKLEAASWCYKNAIWIGACSVIVGTRKERYVWSDYFLDLRNIKRINGQTPALKVAA